MNTTDSINESALQSLSKRATQLWWRVEDSIKRLEGWFKRMAETGGGNTKCTDDSVRDNSAPVQINRFNLPKDARDLIIGILLGLSILVNIWLLYAYRDAAVQQELRRYDFATFKQTDWADLNTRVMVNEKLITILGKCPKE